jgi:hypothetical protein
VQTLPRGREVSNALLEEGIEDIREIPDGRLQNPLHERIRTCVVKGKPYLDGALRRSLRELSYPRYYLDFETIQFAIPRWLGTRPYEQLPFQWSCHKEGRNGNLAHYEVLDVSGVAPMRNFAESLIRSLGKRGPIVVYSHFENTVLNRLAARYPDLADDLADIQRRLVDLLPLVRAHYYHPAMQGSFSIKAVLPTVAPHLSYDDLGEVRDGGAAQAAFFECIDAGTSPERRVVLEAGLRAYCARDTLAMVELVRGLTG